MANSEPPFADKGAKNERKRGEKMDIFSFDNFVKKNQVAPQI